MLLEYLTENNILTHQNASTLIEAIQITASPLLEQEIIEKEYLDSIEETIEKFGLYMIIIPGIAFFHGSHEVGVNEIGISLATFENELELDVDNPDKYIKAAFCFSATDPESHLSILQDLVTLLANEEFLDLIKSNPTKKQIVRKVREITV